MNNLVLCVVVALIVGYVAAVVVTVRRERNLRRRSLAPLYPSQFGGIRLIRAPRAPQAVRREASA